MRYKGLLFAGLALITLAAVCGRDNAADRDGSLWNRRRQFVVISSHPKVNMFFDKLREGMSQAIESHGDQLTTLTRPEKVQQEPTKRHTPTGLMPRVDIDWQALEALLSREKDAFDQILHDADGIFIVPASEKEMYESVLQAKRKRAPCIVVDASARDMDRLLCTVGFDNAGAGRTACRELADVNPNAKVIVLQLSVHKACVDRVSGFEEEMTKYPGMKILAALESYGTAGGGRSAMIALLGSRTDLDAVFAVDDRSALGAISALKSRGKGEQVTVVSIGGSQEAIHAIRAGELHASVLQSPEKTGRVAANTMYDGLKGRIVEKDIRIRGELITAENADDY